MTPEEAIMDLSIQREVKRRLGKTHEAESIGLGIEALKLNLEMRETLRWPKTMVLPGETEE